MCVWWLGVGGGHLESGHGNTGSDGVATVSAAVLPAADGEHHLVVRQHRGDGVDAARQRLAQHQHVRPHLRATPPAGPSLGDACTPSSKKTHTSFFRVRIKKVNAERDALSTAVRPRRNSTMGGNWRSRSHALTAAWHCRGPT